MSERGGGWTIASLPEAHLLPDAVVAFVDGELSAGAHERAAVHIARCPVCAARHDGAAPGAGRGPGRRGARECPPACWPRCGPSPPTPICPTTSTASRSRRTANSSPCSGRTGRAFGSRSRARLVPPAGHRQQRAAHRFRQHGRRAVQGAGVVAAGLVLGALAVVGPHMFSVRPEPRRHPSRQRHQRRARRPGQLRHPVHPGRLRPGGGARGEYRGTAGQFGRQSPLTLHCR